ncbi:hypothetical protein LCGC14_2843730, partial [marine sediment metagenome]
MAEAEAVSRLEGLEEAALRRERG